MLKICPDDLSKEAVQKLADFQNQVDQATSHFEKVEKANALWKTQNVPFSEIKRKLASCSQRGSEPHQTHYCQYCESDRDSAIEHIYPKSAFPERAYHWENYIYACWFCNTKSKGNKYYVFDTLKSAICSNQLEGSKHTVTPNDDWALIDPRVDDPTEMLYLVLSTGDFVVHPDLKDAQASVHDHRKAVKAENTLTLLRLNTLKQKRRAAYDGYLSFVRRYAAIRLTTTYEELNKVLQTYIPKERVEPKSNFEEDKQEMLHRIQYSILQAIPHPTVWYEMKRQRKHKGFEELDAMLETAQIDNW